MQAHLPPTKGLSPASSRHPVGWHHGRWRTIEDQETKVALFRYSLIAPFLSPDLTDAERSRLREEILERVHAPPEGGPGKTVSARSLRRWLQTYRKGGFAALHPKARSDKDKPRRITADILEKAVALREEAPDRSVKQIIDIMVLDQKTPVKAGQVKPSTLARHFKQMGKTRKLIRASKGGFRRYEKDRPNAMWQTDVWYGPYLPDPEHPDLMRRTYLIAFLDDYSRLVPHGAFYWAEDLPGLLDCFKKALLKRGIPTKGYCDNGVIFVSHQFSRIVAELGIHHTRAKAFSTAGKGKVERFWQTVDSSFSTELKLHPVNTLAELNALWEAWLEQGYHQWKNRETGKMPVERFMEGLPDIRLPDPVRLAEIFLWQEQRRVDKTGCVSLQGNRYEVDQALCGKTVSLRYDPFDLTRIQVWHEKKRLADAIPHQLSRQMDHRVRLGPEAKPELPGTGVSYLGLLRQKHDDQARATLGRLNFRHQPKP